MSLKLINRPCTIIRRGLSGTIDDYGNEILSETATESECELQQIRRTENEQQGELSDTRWTVFFQAGTDVRTGDAVVVDGAEYELIGDPWPVWHPLQSVESHIEATARRTTGAEVVGS